MKLKEYPGQEILSQLCGHELNIKFDNLEFSAKLVSVELQKLTALTNPPEKRKDANGKSYTPKCLRLVFETGAFVIVLEDCRIVAVHNGAAFMFENYQLEVRRAN
jgi:hypothetical protein